MGHLVVTDPGLKVVVRVDPQTGDRTHVSGCTALDAEKRCVGEIIGAGPAFDRPAALAVEATGDLVVVDEGLGAVVRVDPHTGERTLVSGCPAIDAQGNCQGPVIGEGPAFHSPWGIAIEATGALVVVDVRAESGGASQPPHRRADACVRLPGDRCAGQLPGTSYGGKARAFVIPCRDRHRGHWRLGGRRSVLQAVMRVDPRTGERTICVRLCRHRR